MFLWKQAVEKAKSIEADAVKEGVRGQTFRFARRPGRDRAGDLSHLAHAAHRPNGKADGQGKVVDAYKSADLPLPYAVYGETES